jgi:lysozyme family protein
LTVDEILLSVLEREGWPTYTVRGEGRLTQGEALAILRRRYVETNGIHRLTDETLRAQVIDDAVLSGPYLAVKDLQHALDTVTVDGIIGPQTLAAIDATDRETLGRRLAVTRTLRLTRHVQAHPDQLVFLTGWVTRTLSFVADI